MEIKKKSELLKNHSSNQKLLQFFKKKNFKFFFFFFIISSFFWIVTKFSNIYKFENDFDINWTNIPKSIIIDKTPKKITVLFAASGFEILIYKIFSNTIEISLDKDVIYENNIGIVNIKNKLYEIENQLFENNKVENIITKKISFYYSVLSRKKVPVVLEKKINFRAGYLNVNDFKLIPDSIYATGPDNIIDTLKNIKTIRFERNDVYQSINEEIELLLLDNISFSKNQIKISSIVNKYSEKEFKVPIKIINLPDSIKLKLFPNYITLKAIVSLDHYNDIIDDDFNIIANYNILNTNFGSISLFLNEYPNGVKNINWYPKTVNYLIRK
ncbi:MAG: hypothetical protein CMC88_03095 [Flavobacteriaceae bacterium]|nr:hypothetical protein [Flavobacteriaceae bacterium]